MRVPPVPGIWGPGKHKLRQSLAPLVPCSLAPLLPVFAKKKRAFARRSTQKHAPNPIMTHLCEIICKLSRDFAKFLIHTWPWNRKFCVRCLEKSRSLERPLRGQTRNSKPTFGRVNTHFKRTFALIPQDFPAQTERPAATMKNALPTPNIQRPTQSSPDSELGAQVARMIVPALGNVLSFLPPAGPPSADPLTSRLAHSLVYIPLCPPSSGCTTR